MNNSSRSALPILIGTLFLALLILLWIGARDGRLPTDTNTERRDSAETTASLRSTTNGSRVVRLAKGDTTSSKTAEEIVAVKLKAFSQLRRETMRAMAKHKNVAVPELVERFFDAVDSGDWAQIKAAFDAINGGEGNAGHGPKRTPEVQALWAPIIDTYGVAEQVHLWPAQKLLDYGNAILDQLRPGMVYVGGTDEGRWVPTLLNETADGDKHIVLTQNGLADGTYLEYLRFLYSDRLAALNSSESERAFKDYMADATRRLEHDEKFPDEPKQIRPGEQIQRVDNRVTVSGQVAVMDINERLLKMLMEKNPELPFALQESFPLKGTYAGAAPLGPIMELQAQDRSGLTPERAAESVAYWNTLADQLRSSPDPEKQETADKSFSKLAVGQANLFAEHGLSEQAEQTYRIALQMRGNNTDAVLGLVGLMERTGRTAEARTFMDQFARDYPKQAADLSKRRASTSVTFQARGD
jgi:hypothetical protein